MTLGDLLDRLYSVLGDIRDAPRFFPRDKLVAYANRGSVMFRSICKDVWYRVDMPVVGMQGEYTIPPEILELRRVAFNDTTLEARSVNVLQSRDGKWQTTTGPIPRVWTSLGFAHNKFWIWPIPTIGTAETFTWDSEYGVTVRDTDSSGADVSFIADPVGVPGWNAEHGLMVQRSAASTESDFGEIFYTETPSGGSLTLWGTAAPATLVSDDQELPMRQAYQDSLWWFVLWQVYEEEGDHHNTILSAFYRDQFMETVSECRERVSNPVPAQVRNLRGNINEQLTPARETVWGDYIDSTGTAVPIIWPMEDTYGY